jgi:CBS domain-containing protein
VNDLEKEFNLKQYMTPNPTVLSPKDTVQHAVEILADGKFQALPVVEDGVILWAS